MISKLLSAERIGLFNALSTPISFGKVTLIYGENGRGKSTLAALLRSWAMGNASLIHPRATIDATGAPTAKILLQKNGRSVVSCLTSTGWDSANPDVIVFDSDFVERNVYSGSSVSAEQRRNLLEFALGAAAVAEKQVVDQSTARLAQYSRDAAAIEKALLIYSGGTDLSRFRVMTPLENVDDEIQILERRIAVAKQLNAINLLPMPRPAMVPRIDVSGFFSILESTLSDLEAGAEEAVKSCISNHGAGNFENWLNEGLGFHDGALCPFCGQSTDGLALLRAYRAYFNRSYRDHQKSVNLLLRGLESRLGDGVIERYLSELEFAQTSLSSWRSHIPSLDFSYDLSVVRESLSEFRRLLSDLALEKQRTPLDTVGVSDSVSAMSRWEKIRNEMNRLNDLIASGVEEIEKYKRHLLTENVSELERKLREAKINKKRFSPEVILEIERLEELEELKRQAEREKAASKLRLDEVLSLTLGRLQGRINSLLGKFGASFAIKELRHDYKGAARPRSDYMLSFRNKSISLGATTGPTFSNILSEGDKRSLAFAFFVATVESDPGLARKIVVIDDPVCSLDRNRRLATRRAIRDIANSVSQVVVLAHDAYFLRDLRDDFSVGRYQLETISLSIERVEGGFSSLGPTDLDLCCSSEYYNHHRILNDFVNGLPNRDLRAVAKSIRPLLEGYLHRRFPGHISRRKMFGNIVGDAQVASPPSPLVHLQPIVSELNEINEFAGQFHHDTNSSADSAPISDSELLAFAKRALNVVHKGAP